MTIMKKTLFFLFVALVGVVAFSCSDNDEIVGADAIPTQAKAFLEQYYPTIGMLRVEKDGKGNSVKYDVYLSDGSEVEFDRDGNWISVDAPAGAAVPEGIVPTPIVDFVADTYPNEKINEISRDNRGYEVELTNEVDLIFDVDGIFIRIEK